MGTADIVPGVSGGTIALLFGIYRRLVASVRAGSSFLGSLLRLDGEAAHRWLRTVEWRFIVPLLVGILLAVFILAGLLDTLLTDYPVQMAAVFFGLIVGSIVVVWELPSKWDAPRIGLLVITALVVFLLLGLREGTSEDTVSQVADPALIAFFASGAVAICAMILPGISGSFILVLLGMYTAVLDAVTDRELGTLAVFALGAVIGLALFSQLLHWGLSKHYDTIVAVLIGLMAGSTRVLWPWPEGLDSTRLGTPDEAVLAAVLLALAAAVIVVALGGAARRIEHRTRADQAEELRG